MNKSEHAGWNRLSGYLKYGPAKIATKPGIGDWMAAI